MTQRVSAPPPGPYRERTSAQPLNLGIEGFEWPDLFSPARLADLLGIFDGWFRARDAAAYATFDAYRACQGNGMSAEDLSTALLAAAPHVSAFVAKLFRVENEVHALADDVHLREPIWKFKKDFAKKRVLRDTAGKAWTQDREAADAIVAATIKALVSDAGKDEELDCARAVLLVLEVDDVARKVAKHGGAHWTDELRTRANIVRGATKSTEMDDGVLAQTVLDAFEFSLARRRRDRSDPVSRWQSLKHPHTLDYQHLVHLRRPDEKLPELFVGPDEDRRQRDSFKLTDKRGNVREVEQEVDYCLYCHDRDKDSCSKGLREKSKDPAAPITYKKNPLGVDLRGCPLEEKISEMHMMRAKGDPLASLALVTIDNPMLPGTGHRICNDCMKACVFQKQEPVNIPQIETRVLTEVLSLPWGIEIYGFLLRWNPLAVARPHARAYNGKNVLVVGLGPAGYTLVHHLACEGFAVVAVDGLKLEPLPSELTGGFDAAGVYSPPPPIHDSLSIYGKLDERILLGFGGVSEYGITVRWDKNFLTLAYMSVARNPNVRMYGGVRFGGTLTLDDAWALGFDHVAIAAGAGRPTLIPIKNNLARGIRQASDFLMALQLTGAYEKSSIANLQVSLPAIVIGGGLTAIDTATELLAYYLVQIDKTVDRWEAMSVDPNARKAFDDEEWSQLEEHVAHGKALRAERAAAARESRAPNVQKLLDSWGGVTLVYRRALQDSPAYRLNHEEVAKSLEEGVRYMENLSPTEAITDTFGHVSAMKFSRKDGSILELPARTVCVAAGTSPNITYEREHYGTFELDAKKHYFKAHSAKLEGGKVTLTPEADTSKGFFTSYAKDGKTVSFYGDNHPFYAGSVVKAMASAKDGYPHVAALFPRPAATGQETRDAGRFELFTKLDEELVATVVAVNRLTKTIVEVVVKAPMAARKFHPGQFYRLQNFETRAKVIGDTRLAMEGLALTGAWVEPEKGLMGTIVLEMGGSSRLCAALEPGEPIVLMGPTGTPTEISAKETVLLCGGGLGNAVLFSIARAFKAMGSRVLYFAGYKNGADVFKQDDIERYTDQVVWATDSGVEISARRPQDAHFRGNIVQAMVAYAKNEVAPGFVPMAPLLEVDRIIAIGSDRMMAAVAKARHDVLAPYLQKKHVAIGSINSPMQCMMKEVCAQCLQRHIDPETGTESIVFSCYNQDQPLDSVDFAHLRQRLRANSMQEKLSNAYLDLLLKKDPGVLRI